MQLPVMTKNEWKNLVLPRVTIYHERELREKASSNYKLEYLNVQALGLTGLPHPAISSVRNTRDAHKMRSHLKFLTGDIESFHNLSIIHTGDSPHCRLCFAECEHTQNILTECRGTSDVRERLSRPSQSCSWNPNFLWDFKPWPNKQLPIDPVHPWPILNESSKYPQNFLSASKTIWPLQAVTGLVLCCIQL